MEVHFTARKFRPRKEIRTDAIASVRKLDKYYDGIMRADIILSYEHSSPRPRTRGLCSAVPLRSNSDIRKHRNAIPGAFRQGSGHEIAADGFSIRYPLHFCHERQPGR